MSSLISFMPLLGQALPKAPVVPSIPWYQEAWFSVLMAFVVLIAPFVIGAWLAKRMRMNDYAWRFGLLIFSLTAGIYICLVGWPPRLGIDLSGGVILVYEVDQSKTSTVDLDSVVEQLRKDFETAGIEATVAATDRGVEVTLPGADPAQTTQVEQQIGKLRISDAELAVESRPIRDGKQVLVYGVKKTNSIDMDRMISAIAKRVNPGGQKEVTVRRMGADRVEVIIPQAQPAEIELIKDKISTAGALVFRILANPQVDQRIIELAQQSEARDVKQKDANGNVVKDENGRDVILAQWVTLDPEKFKDPEVTEPKSVIRQNKNGEWERLVVITPFDVDGSSLSRANPTNDDMGAPAVGFQLNSKGSTKFGELTGGHLPDKNSNLKYRLGIVLDGVLKSAPGIEGQITNNGIIHGGFTEPEVAFLVDILNAGSLPAALSKVPVAENSVSAQLGTDTIRAGAYSMIFSTIAVLIFMQIYYRFAGFVANLAVLMNLILVMALMILIKAHLTLAGLAGLVLSVGMAVDANVLIYERMREEEERGAALRMVIRNGFGRAMSTIIDSHCTTLITGIVLFVIGTDQLRGFATTLVLGLLLNLFTAVYCSRIVFDVAERRKWLVHLRMMKLFGKTNFDFVKWMPVFMTVSVLAIVIGIGGAVAREMRWFGSAGLFGIDFTGGTAVQVVFNKPTDIAVVRKKVADLPDVSVSAIASAPGEERDTHFNIDTSYQGESKTSASGENVTPQTITAVKKRLQEIFQGDLKMYSMDIVSIPGVKVDQNAVPNDGAAPSTDTKPTEKTALVDEPVEKSAEKSPEKPAADATKSADKSKADTSKAAADQKSARKPEAEKPKSSTEIAPSSTVPTETVAKLRFPDGINYPSLDAILSDARKEAMLPDVVFDINSPDKDYTPGSSVAVKDWDVSVTLPPEQTATLLSHVQHELANTPVFPTANNIGGKVASDTETTAYYALFVSNILVAVYIWIRFQNLIFGMAAIVALIHDVFIAVGALALSYWLAGPLGFLQIDPFKISLEVVAALLTIVGYSINDTIVVFDRIREIRGKSSELTATMINQAVNQTLSRTILTSSTVFLVTFILFFAGGEGVHAFAFAMMIGVLTGTYSSVFIAAPILLWFKRPTAATGPVRQTAIKTARASGTA